MSLVEAFWADSTPYVRRLLLDEAAGRRSGRALFEFDVFNVALDFDDQTATVEDSLEADESETTDLVLFLDTAAAFGDDPTVGDGLTQMERRPPTYEVDAGGLAERMPGNSDT